jgi:hypothetical protein
MSSSNSKSSIGTKLTLAVIAILLVGVVTATAVVGVAAVDSIGDSEPAGNASASTATANPAWIESSSDGNYTVTKLYDSDGDLIWSERTVQSGVSDNSGNYAYSTADSEYVYTVTDYYDNGVLEETVLYTYDRSTGELVSSNESVPGDVEGIRIDSSGNISYESSEEYSLTGQTRYTLNENASISVYDTSTGNVIKTISASSYESESASIVQSGGTTHQVLASTDDYTVVSVAVGDTSTRDLHIVSRSSGDSVYEIEDVDDPISNDAHERVVAASDGEIKIYARNYDGSEYRDFYTRFNYTGGYIVEERQGIVNASNPNPITVDFFRNEFAEDVTFTPVGELNLSAVNASDGNALSSNATVKIYNDTGQLIWVRNNVSSSEIYSNYAIDTYGGNYTVRVEAQGYEAAVQDATVTHNETTSLSYSLATTTTDSTAAGTLAIDSVTNDSGTAVSNWSAEIYDSNDSLVLTESNLSAPYSTNLTGNQTYTVQILADGYNTTNKSVTITENQTASTSFTLASSSTSDGDDSTDNTTTDDGDSTDNTTTTDDSDDGGFVGGGGSGSPVDAYAIIFGIGGIGFLLFLLVALFAFRELRKQSFALILVMMVLTTTVGPMLFIDPVSAQTDSAEYETADLLVFTASENKSQVAQETQDKVVALDPNTSEVAWETRLNNSTNGNIVYSVAWDESQNRIYATSMEEDGSIQLYELQDATGDVEDVHKLNLTPELIGKDTTARNGVLYFTTDGNSYRYDFENESLTATNSYTPSAQTYGIGFTDGQAAISTYGSEFITTYLGETEQYQTYTSGNITSIQHTEIGFLYQDNSNISLRNTSTGSVIWSSSTSQSTILYGATSEGQDTIYARVGDDLYSYERDSGNQSVLYDGSIPANTTAGFAQVDFKNGRIHTYQTVGGYDLANDTPTHLYHIHDSETGELLYSEEIAYDSNKHQSVAIVYEEADTVEVIVGGGGSDYSPEDVFGEIVGEQLMLTIGVLGGILFGLIFIVLVLKFVWSTVTAPFRILLFPFKIIWKAMKMVF